MLRLLALCTLFLALPASAQEMHARTNPYVAGSVATASTTYLLQDDFETGTNTQWTKASGTANADFGYAGLVGTYSLYMNETAGTDMKYRNTTNWTAAATTYVYAMVNFGVLSSVPSGDLTKIISLADSGGADICKFGVRDNSGVKFSVQAVGASEYVSSPTPATGTTYHVWLEYVEGTGTATCSIYVSTTSTKPGSASAARTGMTLTTDAVRLYLWAYYDVADQIVFDKVRVDDAVIGSDPS